jgi:hypothetical protein
VNVAGCVAHQRDGRGRPDPAPRPRLPDRQPRQAGPVFSHFAERAEAEVRLQPGALQLFPSDARQVSGHQPEQHAIVLEAPQQCPHARTRLALEVRHAAHVNLLRTANDLRHRAANGRRARSGVPHHARQDIGIEHAMHRDMIGAGLETGHPPHRFHQRLPVMRPGPPHQRTVDVEKYQRGRPLYRRSSVRPAIPSGSLST